MHWNFAWAALLLGRSRVDISGLLMPFAKKTWLHIGAGRDISHKVRFQNSSVLVKTSGFEKVFLQDSHVIYILVVRAAARR